MVADAATPPVTERIARTVALAAELRAVWPGANTHLSVHRVDHHDVHESELPAVAILPPGGTWALSAHMDGTITGPGLFADVGEGCARCTALVEMAKARGVATNGR